MPDRMCFGADGMNPVGAVSVLVWGMVPLRGSVQAVGLMDEPDRVDDVRAGRGAQLPTASLRIAGGEFDIDLLNEVEDRLTHSLGDVVLLLLHAVGARDTTAGLVRFLDRHPGNEFHELHGRQTKPLGLELARRVVGDRNVHGLEVQVKFALIMQVHEELTDVPHARTDIPQFRSVHFEDLVGLVAQHARARAGRGNDRRIAVRLAQVMRQLRHVLPRLVVQAVRLQGEAAAAVMRDENFISEVFKDLDRVDGGLDLEVLAGTAVEEDDLSLASRTGKGGVLLEPAFESATRRAGHRRIAVNANDLLHRDADRFDVERPVRDRSDGRHHRANEPGAANEVVARRDALLLLHCGAGVVDHFRDLHTLRAHERAGATRGAVVDRGVDDLPVLAVALGLRTGVLRPSEEVGDAHNGTLGLTDRALDAGVQSGAEAEVLFLQRQDTHFFDGHFRLPRI